MLDHITSLDKIFIEANQMQEFLEITCSEDGNEVVLRGNDIAVFIARSGKLLADAKFHQDTAKKAAIHAFSKHGYSPSVLKDLVNADAKNENYAVNWLERLNRSATHQHEWCRSVLSKLKQEMSML